MPGHVGPPDATVPRSPQGGPAVPVLVTPKPLDALPADRPSRPALSAAPVVLQTRTRGREIFHSWVVLRCPYCTRPHQHGPVPPGADPRAHLGFRRSHCWPGGEYRLEETGQGGGGEHECGRRGGHGGHHLHELNASVPLNWSPTQANPHLWHRQSTQPDHEVAAVRCAPANHRYDGWARGAEDRGRPCL